MTDSRRAERYLKDMIGQVLERVPNISGKLAVTTTPRKR